MLTTRHLVEHDEIRAWAESHGARPARLPGAADVQCEALRLVVPGSPAAERLETIGWDEWFEAFDRSNLALLVQDRTPGGEPIAFSKLVPRDGREL
ncbi:MAG: hypothetical protein DIU54_010705 [Acidobacteriota bacterium]|mgnify:CR=1 FL=1|jgi:hypothetical protein|nr:MAG: hypothetical protein DIU54_01820 [Acidobacteriota bacterium]